MTYSLVVLGYSQTIHVVQSRHFCIICIPMIFPPTLLSSHARERIQERFKISEHELLDLLNAGIGKKVGKSARSNLVHRLVWSHIDRSILVAIQDVVSGIVLTVLPVDMYRREYASNLTEQRLRHVMNQMVHAGYAPPDIWSPGDKEENVTVYATMSNSITRVALGRWRGEVTTVDLSALGRSALFWTWVAEETLTRGLTIDQIESISAKFSGGDHQQIPYKPQ